MSTGEDQQDAAKAYQDAVLGAQLRENEDRKRKLEEATRLFEEAGAPLGGSIGWDPASVIGMRGGKVEQGGPYRTPGEASPPIPMTQPAPPEPGVDLAALVAMAVPAILAIIDRNQSKGSSERRETFQSYAYVAMASGKTWAEAYDIATELLDCEDVAAGADEKPGPAPEGLGSVGLGGEAG